MLIKRKHTYNNVEVESGFSRLAFFGMTTQPAPPALDPADTDQLDEVWKVVVWNDPVNLIDYVIWVFRKLFGYSEEKATELTMKIHHEGRAVVSDGPRERAEMDCYRLHRHGLWATLEK
jgi:ATP-dependent Clp protease adaptor protein ClpS